MGQGESQPVREKSEEASEDKSAPRNLLKEAQTLQVSAEERTPNQALLHAAEKGDLEGIRAHLKAGADCNAADNGPLIPEGKQDDPIYKHAIVTGDFALHKAAQNGHVEAVNLLYLSMAKIDNKDRLGSTALHRAVSHNQPAVVRELLKPGYDADTFARNNIGNTPLHIAAYCGYTDIARILLEAGASRGKDMPNRVGMTPLDYARKAAMRELIANYRPGMTGPEIELLTGHSTSSQRPESKTNGSIVSSTPAAALMMQLPGSDGRPDASTSTSNSEPVTIRWWGEDGRHVDDS